MKRLFRRLFLALFFPVFVLPMAAQIDGNDDFYLFGDDKVLEVTLRFDFTTYIRKKPADEYMDAELIYHFSESDSLVNNIRLRSRGNSRNELCIIPPIRLNFKNCENRPLDLDGVSNVKLVTHCKDNDKFEDYILKEYLSFKLYNVVKDSSFRVRLLHIKYSDTGAKGHEHYRYGFVIEPVDVISDRLNAIEKEDVVARANFIDPECYDKLSLFQYMIGNDDWHLANLHNLKLIEPVKGNKMLLGAVPYDFDYAGLVETYYAIPNKIYGLEDIRSRIYIGPCRSDESIRELMQFFMDHKQEFYDEIEKIEEIWT
jgi:hypothetical protein